MNRKQQLDKLLTAFTEEKRFISDGYYRIRTINPSTLELAYLLSGPCGDSIVHPQITLSINGEEVVGIKLIDMYSSPQLFMHRNDENSNQIDNALDKLIEKFLTKM
ncbi:hypothetical protein UAY_00409 [Enterococcus moraviensis ATCC BAA-383]|uniref:Uncharacterized protein n=1 Tax=Enterococcus moraviensis ATCC BAA-383 TaxID=1158609 RepID=R2TGM2_9ENTE|nr:hypothetical protein [Enterococcus moraviensis]EOI06358.1 hypothetical protein UAY_00409 [Enterococcus moraviensis ATCC BAA-383]EOT63718.1 hypothetical protein I586_03151 [Enterococcus moraviensis ATCC BAA-383]